MIIVSDIGGTNMRLAGSAISDQIEEPVVCRTPSDFTDAVEIFRTTAYTIANGREITEVVVGIAGLLSHDRSTLLKAPHLQGWEGKEVEKAFHTALGVPVRFENDVALGALGEAHYGAGVGADIVAYIAVGTGMNGARIDHGEIDHTAFGFEIGHQILGDGASAADWESLVSGSALAARYGMPAVEITDAAVWDEVADHFAQGLYNTILLWSPDRVVLGGSLFIGKNPIPLERVVATLRTLNKELPELPDIRLAALGDSSGLYGALAFSRA